MTNNQTSCESLYPHVWIAIGDHRGSILKGTHNPLPTNANRRGNKTPHLEVNVSARNQKVKTKTPLQF